ncbi:MAG: hypothetical protein V8Q79_04490 [Christensenellales bacterium]
MKTAGLVHAEAHKTGAAFANYGAHILCGADSRPQGFAPEHAFLGVCRKSLKTPSATPVRASARVSPTGRKWRSCSRAAAMIPRRISEDSPRKMTIRDVEHGVP